jgi:tRNA (cmo5U34)-methyltransferase
MSVNLWTEASHARDYLEHRREIPHRDEGYAALLEFVPDAPSHVLDLGTGDGHLLAMIRQARPGVVGVAVDFSAEMLGRARERFAEDADVTVVDHNLDDPLPDSLGRFDVVVSAFAIHHVSHERKRALYGEVGDHLEPGGVFCNLDHVSSPTADLHQAFLVRLGLNSDDPSNQLLDVETQLRWLRELGFDSVDCHWKWRELALLAGNRPG